MDLLKAFYLQPRDLLLAKSHSYGLEHRSLNVLKYYLHHLKMRVRVGSELSNWLHVIFGFIFFHSFHLFYSHKKNITRSTRSTSVLEDSILGPLLFNIFIKDIFWSDICSEICNFADDNTIFAPGSKFEGIVDRLNEDKRIQMSLSNSLDTVDTDIRRTSLRRPQDIGAHWGNNQKVLNPDKF